MNKLTKYLYFNAVFSGVSGLIFLLANNWFSNIFNIQTPLLLIIISSGLIIFSLFILLVAAKLKENSLLVASIIIMDILWVVLSVIIIAAQLFNLSFAGYMIMTGIALMVGFLAQQQYTYSQLVYSEFEVETDIDVSQKTAWDVLADIGNIHKWNPGVLNSFIEGKKQTGEEAARHCDLGKNNYLKEIIVRWEPESRLTMRITDTNLPFVTADIRFSLNPVEKDKTTVKVSPVYSLKYGLPGKFLDLVFVKNNYQKGMLKLLAGLKAYLEKE